MAATWLAPDLLWLSLCSVLVLVMQAGFLCLEQGLTRHVDVADSAIKSLSNFALSVVLFWLLGFGLMFGPSVAGWLGADGFFLNFLALESHVGAWFLFQALVCAVVVAAVSAAVTARVHFVSHLCITLLLVAVLYPVFGHWAWSGLESGVRTGWLGLRGFVDIAGSSVAHSVAGWTALAVILIVGPTQGHPEKTGEKGGSSSRNLPFAVFGALLLFIGWLGLNSGAALVMQGSVPAVMANTLLAGGAGAIAAGTLGYAVQNRVKAEQYIQGGVGGLVGISAACAVVSTPVAILVGLVGGMITIGLRGVLEYFDIEDAIGAVPVFLGCGIWGSLAVGLYGDLALINPDFTRLEQVWIQCVGVVSCGVWTFGIAYPVLRMVNRFYPFRAKVEPVHSTQNRSCASLPNRGASE